MSAHTTPADSLTLVVRAAHAACAGVTGAGATAVVALRDGGPNAAVVMHGNTREIAAMALTVLGMGLTKPRPSECDACADAWDAMTMARAILRDIAGACG